MKDAEKRNGSPENSIDNLKCGRSILLVRKFIMGSPYNGGQATFSVAIAVVKTLIKQGDNESLKVLKFGKDWV